MCVLVLVHPGEVYEVDSLVVESFLYSMLVGTPFPLLFIGFIVLDVIIEAHWNYNSSSNTMQTNYYCGNELSIADNADSWRMEQLNDSIKSITICCHGCERIELNEHTFSMTSFGCFSTSSLEMPIECKHVNRPCSSFLQTTSWPRLIKQLIFVFLPLLSLSV